MIAADAPAFDEIVTGLFEAMGLDAPTRGAKRIWWEALKDLDMEQVASAAGRFVRERKGRPSVAELREIACPSLYPTPEEAWNMAPKDESETAWVFPEMMAALVACQDSLVAGDRIGARKAFLQVYERETAGKTARPQWWISDANNLRWDQREQVRLDLMRKHPERAGAAQIANQTRMLECASGHEMRGEGMGPLLAHLPQEQTKPEAKPAIGLAQEGVQP